MITTQIIVVAMLVAVICRRRGCNSLGQLRRATVATTAGSGRVRPERRHWRAWQCGSPTEYSPEGAFWAQLRVLVAVRRKSHADAPPKADFAPRSAVPARRRGISSPTPPSGVLDGLYAKNVRNAPKRPEQASGTGLRNRRRKQVARTDGPNRRPEQTARTGWTPNRRPGQAGRSDGSSTGPGQACPGTGGRAVAPCRPLGRPKRAQTRLAPR
jgi:hypothetical protein